MLDAWLIASADLDFSMPASRMSRRVMMLFLTLFAGEPHPAGGQASAPAQIAGCYAVSIGLWSPALGSDAPFHAIPAEVSLDTIPVERGAGWRLSPEAEHRDAATMSRTPRWEMVLGEDVRLTWSDGGKLTVAQLIPDEGKRLVGEAVALSEGQPDPDPRAQWWTKEPPGPRAPAYLERRPCGDEAKHTERASTASGIGTLRPWPADLALANRVAGCYELVGGSWQTDSALAGFEPMPRGPVRFELSKVPDPDQTRLAASLLRTYFETRSSALFSSWFRVSTSLIPSA